MSGIEIAGLVLGAIPLLISALEHYEGALDSAYAFFKWRGELSTAIRKLLFQRTSYEQSVRILLNPITTEQELSDMMADSANTLWKSQDMAQALRGRLGEAYQAYMLNVEQIKRITESLAGKLDIDGADKVTQQGLEAIVLANRPRNVNNKVVFHFGKAVNFTMKRQKVRKLLEELETCNGWLDTYASKAEKLEESYKATKKSKFVTSLQTIEKNAARLYNSLSRAWCSAHTSHHAGLLLEPRLAKKRKQAVYRQKGYPENSDAELFALSLLKAPSTRKWFEVEFRLFEELAAYQPDSSTVQIKVSTVSSSTRSPTAPLEPASLELVENLCSILQQPSHPCIGFCLDSNDDLRGAYPAQPRAVAFVDHAVSLEEILLRRQGSLSKEVEEVYSLCITLSSSLLQLSQTPWLHHTWGKADIIFLRAKDASKSSIDLKHPYLTREHAKSNTKSIRHSSAPDNDCSKLLALGVLLMEINSGKPIEHLRRAEDTSPNNERNELIDLQILRRWMLEQKNKGELTFAFYSAIAHCLKCFVDPTASLQNPEFRTTIESQILSPLEEEMAFLLFGPNAK
ncbi:MAG: hypothetical protein M1820_006965 [Bogoriella megaspora]|nr:MAG: hypothetical protein M1820_006965 [Bogoriella megaspora]